MSHVRRTYAARLALTAAALVALAGCGHPAPEPSDDGTVSVAIQPTLTLDTPTPDVIDTSAAGAAGGFDLSAQLTTTSCAAVDGSWTFTGSLRNPGSDELRATVAISLVKTSDMTVVTTKEIDLVVPAGETVPVEAKDFHRDTAAADAADGIECVTGASDKEG